MSPDAREPVVMIHRPLRYGRQLGFALLCCACPVIIAAQSADPAAPAPRQPIFIGESLTFDSEVLGEERPILVYTPPGYETAVQQHYPVIYVLDGGAHFQHATGVVSFLASVGRMPPAIVIGVPSQSQGKRTRDLTPEPRNKFGPDGVTPWREWAPTAGGADLFLRFLTEELTPFIDSEYRTAPLRILVGHSLGGLFNVHTFLTDPGAFRGHVIISPSLWWDHRQLIDDAQEFFERKEPAGFLYVTMANEGGNMLTAVQAFSGILGEHASDSLRWRFTLMEDETHTSVHHRSLYDGLEWMFADWIFTPEMAADFAAGDRIDLVDERFALIAWTYGVDMFTSEAFLNRLGYVLLRSDRVDEAIDVFAENASRFPGSANVYDSLGDAFTEAGDLYRARDNYLEAYQRARARGLPNTAIYKRNLDRTDRLLTNQ